MTQCKLCMRAAVADGADVVFTDTGTAAHRRLVTGNDIPMPTYFGASYTE